MSEPEVTYYHDLSITLRTSYPENEASLADQIKALLGPWCIAVRAVNLNSTGTGSRPLTFLDTLEVPVRVFNVLRANGKETREQICALKAGEFMRFKNAGRKSLKDLREALDAIGVSHNLGTSVVKECLTTGGER